MPTRDDLYLAYRQAKATLFFDRLGIGLIDLAKFEYRLEENLDALASVLSVNGGWFDDLPIGEVWVVPKRLRPVYPTDQSVTRIGTRSDRYSPTDLDIQLRLSISPQSAIVEVLYLWHFGPWLESFISPTSIGNRLDIHNNTLARTRRYLFQHWQTRYEEYRTVPIRRAETEIAKNRSVLILSADLASFYDTIDPSFLLHDNFIAELANPNHHFPSPPDVEDYRIATTSLLHFYASFREIAARRTGLDWPTGIPIGALTSRVVANLSLVALDREIEARNDTLCYRRYVDDFVIVASDSDADESSNLDDIIAKRIPYVEKRDQAYSLNVNALGRPGSEFSIQSAKCKAFHLKGPNGRRFLEAIRDDYGRLVSENRAFLERSVLEGAASREGVPVLRVTDRDEPVTVLRDADRLKLRRFALATKLRTIQRMTVLLDDSKVADIVSKTLNDVNRFLSTDHNWVENLNLCYRILQIGVYTKSWAAAEEIVRYMDDRWGNSDALRRSVRHLEHRGRVIRRASAWVWLRNFLHARRVEALCAAIGRPNREADLPDWLRQGIIDRTRPVRARALIGRGSLFALSDLRFLDREDDTSFTVSVPVRSQGSIGSDDRQLGRRLKRIQDFVDISRKIGNNPWAMSPVRLFLCTRPPSYFDIARRVLYRVEIDGFTAATFDDLLELVNAVRGTRYSDPIGVVIDDCLVQVVAYDRDYSVDPRITLGNLVVDERCFMGAARPRLGSSTGHPVLTLERLRGVDTVLRAAAHGADRDSLLVLPELSIPRRWFRDIATYVTRRQSYGLVAGLEYLHDWRKRLVYNQAYAVLPGPYQSVAVWPWTKRFPAREELAKLQERGVSFDPKMALSGSRRVTVDSQYGRFSVLICSELIEARRVADLVGRVELVLVPAWNKDTASFDHLIQSAGLQLHAIIAIANNGKYSESRTVNTFQATARRAPLGAPRPK